jgi:superfamily II DNA or RNA helicase
MTFKLRDYQVEAKNKIVSWSKENPDITPTIVACMGSGKTILACSAIETLVKDLGLRVWVLVNREELVDQWQDELKIAAPRLASHGRDVGVIAGSNTQNLFKSIQIVMVQTLTRRLDKINDKFAPHVIICDESHETAFNRVTNKIKVKWPNVKQINLTATPCRHGKAPVQYSDLFPKENWYIVKTAREMIFEGLWKRPIWKSAGDKLGDITTERFSGMKETGGDYDDTSQASVMISLLPYHLKEWQEQGGSNHSCVWFCVNVDHTNKVVAALNDAGRKAVGITGESNKTERAKAIADFKQGKITDLVNCQCLTTGFDAPIASCAVWLRRTLSVGLFNQMAGRVLRKFDGVNEALMLDLAGNLALHPFPELIDWLDFDPCQRMFRDPSLVMCRNCNHRHDAIPNPLHPTDPKHTRWLTGMACFKDGLEISPKNKIVCHSCKEPLYYCQETLEQYSNWLKACAKAKTMGRKPPAYSGSSAGISIGKPTENKNSFLTIETLYEYGIWRISEGGEKPDKPIKDRSEEYRELRIKCSQNFSKKELCDLRFSLLNPEQQEFIYGCSLARLREFTDVLYRYRCAIALAYITDKSPVWAYQVWDKELGGVPKAQIEQALKSIWQGNPDTYEMLEKWLQSKIEETKEHNKKAICRAFLGVLQNLTWSDHNVA